MPNPGSWIISWMFMFGQAICPSRRERRHDATSRVDAVSLIAKDDKLDMAKVGCNKTGLL